MFSHTKLNFNIVSCSWGVLTNDCKTPLFQKSVVPKENCTFDDSGVMGWYTGGLTSHQGTLKLAPISGKRSESQMFSIFLFAVSSQPSRGFATRL